MKKNNKPASVVNIAEYMPKKRTDTSGVLTHLLVILAVIAAIYFNSINNGFVADDISFVKDNTSIRSLKNVPDFFFSPKSLAAKDSEWGTIIYRPLRTASYALDYALFGLNPAGYHAVNLVLHTAATVSLYFVILNLFNISGAAFLGALLFAVHPVHIEAVSWISSRADLIGLVLVNLVLLSYFRYKLAREKAYLALALFLSFLSYLGKETMVALPGLIILYDYASSKRPAADTIKTNIASWAFFSIVTLAYLVIRFDITGRMSTNQGWWGGTVYSNFLMMIEATATYIRLLVIPYNFTFHYIIEPVYSVTDPGVAVSLLVISITLAAMVYSHFKNKMVFFALAWFYIGLVPIANIVPISFSMMAERYIYMPSEGPIIAAGYGLYLLYRKLSEKGLSYERFAVGVIVAIMLVFSIEVVSRNKDYRDEFAFFSSAVKVSPDSAPSNKGLADQYYNRKEFDKAITHYERAVAIDQGYIEALLGEAITYRDMKELPRALAAANRAALVAENVASLKPKNPLIRFNLGNVYREMGDLEAARGEWEKAVELDPGYSEAYNNLGIYYQLRGDYPEAIEMFERSLEQNPFNTETYYNAGSVYEAMGETAKAKEYYARFMEMAGTEYGDTVEGLRKKGY